MLSEEEITDRIAAEVAAHIQAHHPGASARHRRALVRAYTRRALCQPLSLAEVGAIIGQSPQRVQEIQSAALARAYHAYLTRYPHIFQKT